jgi:hypothetical protein
MAFGGMTLQAVKEPANKTKAMLLMNFMMLRFRGCC